MRTNGSRPASSSTSKTSTQPFAELDARYLAGEAAAHAQTWSVIAGVYATFNRGEFPATTMDWVSIDHRPVVSVAAGDMAASIREVLNQLPNLHIYIEAVHRLTDLGTVISHVAQGVSQEGFDAEWRMIFIYTVEGNLISRFEFFDEADLDAALARFDELSRPARNLENVAIRAWGRVADAFNRRDLDDCLAQNAADGRYEDRRKGLRDERAAQGALHTLFELAPSSWRLEIQPVAIRGSRIGLTRERYRDTGDADRPITSSF